jgi:hypothetical protein
MTTINLSPEAIIRLSRSRSVVEAALRAGYRVNVSRRLSADRFNEALGRQWATERATWPELLRWENPHVCPGELSYELPDDVRELIRPEGTSSSGIFRFKSGVLEVLREFRAATRH